MEALNLNSLDEEYSISHGIPEFLTSNSLREGPAAAQPTRAEFRSEAPKGGCRLNGERRSQAGHCAAVREQYH